MGLELANVTLVTIAITLSETNLFKSN